MVYNRNHDMMPNGYILSSSGGYDHQPVMAVQQLSDDSSYFLFAMGMNVFPSFDNAPLTYSIVNMRLDGGLGDIQIGQHNIYVPGAENSTSALSGTRHHNNHDVWIVVRN